jgi:hypothetical protein
MIPLPAKLALFNFYFSFFSSAIANPVSLVRCILFEADNTIKQCRYLAQHAIIADT